MQCLEDILLCPSCALVITKMTSSAQESRHNQEKALHILMSVCVREGIKQPTGKFVPCQISLAVSEPRFCSALKSKIYLQKASGWCNSDSIELTIYTALASLPCFRACHHERYWESEGFVLLPLSLGCLEMPFLKGCPFTEAVPVRDQILGSNLADGSLFGAQASPHVGVLWDWIQGCSKKYRSWGDGTQHLQTVTFPKARGLYCEIRSTGSYLEGAIQDSGYQKRLLLLLIMLALSSGTVVIFVISITWLAINTDAAVFVMSLYSN